MNSEKDHCEENIPQKSQLQNLRKCKPPQIPEIPSAGNQEPKTVHYKKIDIKPIENYEILYKDTPLLVVYCIDHEEEIIIQIDIKKKFFLIYTIDYRTRISDPIPIKFGNKNDRALYKREKTIYKGSTSLNCLIN